MFVYIQIQVRAALGLLLYWQHMSRKSHVIVAQYAGVARDDALYILIEVKEIKGSSHVIAANLLVLSQVMEAASGGTAPQVAVAIRKYRKFRLMFACKEGFQKDRVWSWGMGTRYVQVTMHSPALVPTCRICYANEYDSYALYIYHHKHKQHYICFKVGHLLVKVLHQ